MPTWVLGRLFLNLGNLNSNPKSPSDQFEWVDIGVQAYTDDQGQLHLFEQSHQLVLKMVNVLRYKTLKQKF